MKDQIKEHLLTYSYFANQNVKDLSSDFQLIDSGIITSIDIVNLVSYLEQSYKIKVFVEDIIPSNFQTINEIELFVKNKLK